MKVVRSRLARPPGLSMLVAAAVLAALCPATASAALGDDASSVVADQARFGARLKLARRPAYAVHELALPTGATVRELVSGTGKVFAVTWSGGWRPDLRQLLGSHYARFLAGTRGRRAARGIARIELPGLTVVMGGHLRTFFGRAVLTDLVPAGVDPEELR